MNGTNKTTFSFTAKKGATVSLYVQNSKGKTIRILVKNRKNTGKVSAAWDGKQDNGAYVSNGTYKVVARATNGKETLYRTASIKVSDKVKPSIKLGSSALFSPVAKGKLTISYQLNKSAKVTAVIYDKNNKSVKTLLQNRSLSGGKKSLTWDGKNSKGKRVSDGTYKLVMTSIDSNKNKGAKRQMSIKVDNKKPTASLVRTSTVLKMDGKAKKNAKITFKEQVTVTAYATDAKGTKLKKLASNKTFKAGAHYISWDGRNDKGAYLAEGQYLYLVEFEDAAGNKTTLKSKQFSLQDWRKPAVSSSKDFYYRSNGNASYAYTISKPGKVTVQILQGSKVIRTVQPDTTKPAGKNTFTWDGKGDNGSLLADGKYTYKITVTDKYNQKHTYTGNMHVAVTKVTITHPAIVEFYSGAEVASEVYYQLSQDAKVTIEIYDPYNEKIRTLAKEQPAQKGINHFKWDGLDEEGLTAYEDFYFYVIKAENAAGNVTTVKGEMNLDKSPPWLTSILYSFTQNDMYENSDLNLKISTLQGAYLNLYVFDGYYSEELLDSKSYSLVKGTNALTYKKLNTNNLYYLMVLKDALGNEYFYGIDEADYISYSRQGMEEAPKLKKPETKPKIE